MTLGNDNSSKLLISIIAAVIIAHVCNDFIQFMLPSIYPLSKIKFALSYTQIGLITVIY